MPLSFPEYESATHTCAFVQWGVTQSVSNLGIQLDAYAFRNSSAACLPRAPPSISHLPAVFRLHARTHHSQTAWVARPRDFVVITESSAATASENLWSVDFRHGSAHNDGLFLKLSEIWSGVNTECCIVKLTRCFNVSVSDFLSHLICWIAALCSIIRQNRSLAYLLPRWSRNATQPQSVEARKYVSSAAVPEHRRTAHTSGGTQG